jgi:predicted RND superfamily exporter protein
MDHLRVVRWLDRRIINQPGTIVLLFLIATVGFATGLGAIETESGQGQFVEDLPSAQALEDVQQDFGSSFTSSVTTGSTLVQRSNNVLSKPALLRMLRTQKRIADYDPLRVTDTSSPARSVARQLDPEAGTLEAQIRAVEQATPSQIDAAVRQADEQNPSFDGQLSTDFNARAASATAAEGSITHRAGPGEGASGGPGGGSEFPPNKEEQIERILSTTANDIQVVGSAPNTISTTLTLVLPAALLFITLFLIVAYRDPFDLVLGLVSIAMMLIWTFGFIGIVGIPFNVLLVTVPPLLIAIGIDFGIHAVNRYREERVEGKSIDQSMKLTTDQLIAAFFIVMATSAIGFLSNVVSAFPPNRDLGVVAASGVAFTFFIFGIFLPAAKVYLDRIREQYPIPTISDTPLGSESSPLGRVLGVGVVVAKRAPVLFAIVLLISTAGAGVYATGVDTGFSPDDFLPAEETPDYLQALPDSVAPPAEFEYVELDNYRDRKFEQDGQVLMYVEGQMERDSALESIHRASADPPETFDRDRRAAEAQSIISIIQSRVKQDEEFAALVRRNDRNDNGIPDDNLGEIYDALEQSPASDQVDEFLSEDRRSALVIYTVDGDADNDVVTSDARHVAADYRMEASPTGNSVIFDEAIALVFSTVIDTLLITLGGSAVFLVFIYWVLEGRPSLGIANVIPIVITVVAVVASMRAFGIKFNAINGSILAITIGLGIDYSVHVVHRFIDEYNEVNLDTALRRTVIGTGGALTGSMLTTVFGVGVLAIALNPAVGVYGILTAMSVFYAYLASIFVLPTVLVFWDWYVNSNIPTLGIPPR